MQLTVLIRTVVTCAEVDLLGVGALPFGAVVGVAPPAGVPPGLAASDERGAETVSTRAITATLSNLEGM